MHKGLIVPIAIGLAVVGVVVAGILYMQRGAHIEPAGSVLKIRTHDLDSASSVAFVDFRVINASDYTLVIRQVQVSIEGRDGKTHEGTPVSAADADNVLQYLPMLGHRYNPYLLMRDKIPARSRVDRTAAARFDIPVTDLDARKNLAIRVEEVDGATAVIHEK